MPRPTGRPAQPGHQPTPASASEAIAALRDLLRTTADELDTVLAQPAPSLLGPTDADRLMAALAIVAPSRDRQAYLLRLLVAGAVNARVPQRQVAAAFGVTQRTVADWAAQVAGRA